MNKRKKVLYEIINTCSTVVISFIVVALFTNYIAKPTKVSGDSMYPTLHDHDMTFSAVMGLNESSIERFDIVVAYMEEDDKYIVKRVIGLPNETIQYSNGQLLVDGVIVEEPFLDNEYVNSLEQTMIFTSDTKEVTLGDGEFYLLGDNRVNSADSRYYGPFNIDEIVSKGTFVFFPIDRIGFK